MRSLLVVALAALPIVPTVIGAQTAPARPLAERIVHTDPAKYRPSPAVHGGPGQLDYMSLLDHTSLDTNLFFLHRGIIQPKSGIGAHFHNQCEEMFVIFNGEAQFTVDGRTSLLKGPAGAPVRMGHSHAIYNHTDQPVRVDEHQRLGGQGRLRRVRSRRSARRRVARPDSRVHDDAARQGAAAPGRRDARRQGSGAVPPRPEPVGVPRVHGPMSTIWCCRAGTTVGPNTDPDFGAFYYVMDGSGRVTIGGETAPIVRGDAIPLPLKTAKTFENTGTTPLELLVVGVAGDPQKKDDLLPRRPPPRG